MTSQLNVDTIVDKAGTGGPTVQSPTLTEMNSASTYASEGGAVSQNTVQGVAKSWARVSAGTSLVHGFNISSFTNNSTGDSTLSYTNTFSDTQHIAANATVFVVSGSTFVAQVQEYNLGSIRVDTKGDADDESGRSYTTVVLGELA